MNKIGQRALTLKPLKQVDHLRLNGDIQRGNRLIADDEARLRRQRAGDADALALAAGKLVRIARHVLAAQADVFHELHDLLLPVLRVPRHAMDVDALGDDVAHLLARVERRIHASIPPDRSRIVSFASFICVKATKTASTPAPAFPSWPRCAVRPHGGASRSWRPFAAYGPRARRARAQSVHPPGHIRSFPS